MINLLFFIMLISTAVCQDERFYQIGDLLVRFEGVDGLLVNGGCADKKCQAYEFGKRWKNARLPRYLLKGGKNPSAVKCKHLMEGKVIIATDLHGNQQSLCAFTDGSFLL